MARLDLEAAPPVALPRAGLTLAAGWGVLAGLVLAIDGADAAASRWSPSALALVHALTLGVFGNAATGALLQFLPAAAGVRVGGGPRAGVALLALLNIGALALVAGFRTMRGGALAIGGLLVASALAGLALATLPGLLRARPWSTLHAGLATAVAALAVTAGVGSAMLPGLLGRGGLAPLRWIDVHAAWGLGGAMVLLVAGVAQQVVPMFQGAPAMSVRAFGAWQLALVASLLAVAASRASTPALLALGTCVGAWAASTLARQARPWRPKRNPVLAYAWRGGCAAMIAAVAAGVAAGARVAGAVALGLALPLMLVPMLLEITAFLGWLGLYRAVRGRVPGVHALQPERAKGVVVALHAVAGLALAAAVLASTDAVARAAGVALVLAHSALLAALLRLHRRCARVLHDLGRPPLPAG